MRELLGIILLLVLVWVHYKNVHQGQFKSFYFPALALKILAGVGVGLVYKYYYLGGDTWTYFYQAELLGKKAFTSWNNLVDLFFLSKYQLLDGFAYLNQPRAALMVKLVAIINLFTGANYWITSAYFSFFSFIGVWAFASWIERSFIHGRVAGFALFIWPSFVFWSSGILKESVAVGLIFWIIAGYLQMIDLRLFKKSFALLVAFFFLFLIKYYFAVVLFVVLIVHGIVELTSLSHKNYWQKTTAWVLILSLGMILGGYLHPNLEPLRFLDVIINNNKAFVVLSNDSSLIHFTETSVAWKWLLINSPKALFAGLFMPLSLNSESLFYSIAVVENGLLLILFARGTLTLKLDALKSNFNLIVASVFYISMLAVFLSLSTPNLGTLSRYKVSYIPVFLVLILLANRFSAQEKQL